MKKVLCLAASLVVLFGCACSFPSSPTTEMTEKAEETDDTDVTDSSSDSDNSFSIDKPSGIKFDYPDQLKIEEGGTDSMTIYRCGVCYYACTDGNHSWGKLYGTPPVSIEEGEFIHVDADFDRAYGGVKGYMGNMYVRTVRDEKMLTLDEVVDCGMLELYDDETGTFFGLRLIVQDGKNYLICRDPMLQYRLYDDSGNLICTYETSMAAANYLNPEADHGIQYGSSSNWPYWVIRIGDIYYAYSRYDENYKWTPLLNMRFENKPVGFELEDGQAMKINSTRVYLVNGGEAGYDNAPMFESTDHFFRINYDGLISDTAYMHWEEASQYENGKLYKYSSGLDEYMIFYITDEFYVFHEYSCDIDSDEFVGKFSSPEEVNNAIRR